MVKSIDDILKKEARELLEIQTKLGDPKTMQILEGVFHIECSTQNDLASVTLYPSLTNPYMNLVRNKHKLTDAELDAERIKYKKMVRERIAVDRRKILKKELQLRTKDIEAHKWYLSESAEHDVGLLIASAHWLKDISSRFYEQSKEQCRKHNVAFEWLGMERSIVINAPQNGNRPAHCVLVLESDLLLEENLAQYASGVVRSDPAKTNALARIVRTKLKELYNLQQFYVLKR